MLLQKYPLDTQTCPIMFESCEYIRKLKLFTINELYSSQTIILCRIAIAITSKPLQASALATRSHVVMTGNDQNVNNTLGWQ